MVSYTTNFGNGDGNVMKIYGEQGVIDLTSWTTPTYSSAGAIKPSKLPKEATPVPAVETPDHFLNWLQCLRTREVTNAPIEAGYQHCVPALDGHAGHGHRPAANLRRRDAGNSGRVSPTQCRSWDKRPACQRTSRFADRLEAYPTRSPWISPWSVAKTSTWPAGVVSTCKCTGRPVTLPSALTWPAESNTATVPSSQPTTIHCACGAVAATHPQGHGRAWANGATAAGGTGDPIRRRARLPWRRRVLVCRRRSHRPRPYPAVGRHGWLLDPGPNWALASGCPCAE